MPFATLKIRPNYFNVLGCVHTVVLLYDVVLVQKYEYDLLLHRTHTFSTMLKKIVQTVVHSTLLVSCTKISVRVTFSMEGWIFVQNIAFLFLLFYKIYTINCFIY